MKTHMGSSFSFASGNNAEYIDSLYRSYLNDPNAVDASWQAFFAGYEFAAGQGRTTQGGSDTGLKHARVEAYVNAYRRLGHLEAKLNPLAIEEPAKILSAEDHDIADIQDQETFSLANFGREPLSLVEITSRLKKTYSASIGADFREINDIDAITWLQEEMESCQNSPAVSSEKKKRILQKLAEAEGFERFLQARYLGQKRFSLEGLESLIPLLDEMIDDASSAGVEEIFLGMAHRGRLNVLANIMGKPISRILYEFEGSDVNPFDIDGDVKYHLGFGTKIKSASGKDVSLYLAPNPSHLEAVNPVLEGFARCRQDLRGANGEERIMPVLLHGDASFIGQGLVSETLNLSQLSAYHTGGTIHIITNNQIGFTTNPTESRSCGYSSDISKIVRAPVFHVNADDPLAVIWVACLAAKFRKRYKRDVVIDLVGYRRHGHNETDEPTYTQPSLYQKITNHPSVLAQFAKRLVEEGVISEGEVTELNSKIRSDLQASYDQLKAAKNKSEFAIRFGAYGEVFTSRKVVYQDLFNPVDTKVPLKKLRELAHAITTIPPNFTIHPKLTKTYSQRAKMLDGEGAVDWAFAELLAFASLADQSYRVRLTGQDSRRGTFSSRHGVLTDYTNGSIYQPLNTTGRVEIINSPLSEQGCLGFEFGYSIADAKALVLWEAQFGDFVNGAQIIIDQFLTASEAKWHQTSGIVLLLPHGYEGMGPEHSSARPERFLQSSGNLNIQVMNLTTPAQLFHALRRQMLRDFRKPLIIMTPKSLLRHPLVVSKADDFVKGSFMEIIDEEMTKAQKAKVTRVLMCTGKIFYELLEARQKNPELTNIAIVRVEQLYPFFGDGVKKVIAQYSHVKSLYWVQEEPKNMGAWQYIRPRIQEILPQNLKLDYIGRKNSGSTAEGSSHSHKLEQARIVDEALGLACAWSPKQ